MFRPKQYIPEYPVRLPELESVPSVICASCGADWSEEPCDVGCTNDLDTSAKIEQGDES